MKIHPETLHRYIEDATDLILTSTPSGRVTFANNFAAKILGYPKDKLLRKPLLSLVEEHSRDLADDLFEFIRKGEGWHGEILLQRENGDVFPSYVSANPILDVEGVLEGILFVGHDISERKKFEEELRKRAELGNSILRSAPIGIFTLDTTEKIKTINHAMTAMLGSKPPNALIDQKFDTISRYFNPDLLEYIRYALQGDEARIYNRPLSIDGPRDITVSLIAVPLKDSMGSQDGVLVLVENRTDAVRVEEQLLQADKLATTGFLAAGIAHEINNPLAGIRTIIEMLERRIKKQGGDIDPYQKVLGNIDRIRDIIKRLLEYANPASLQPVKSDINSLTQQILEFFKYHKYFMNIKVVWNLDDELPEIVVDPKQIQQIIHNIAMNAAQSMKDSGGKLTIATRLMKVEDDKFIELSMADTGQGIKEDIIRRIFDPFFTTKPPGEGTGLGLSVSHSIAKNHGGSLIARNHPDGGAEFILRLPLDGADTEK
ncbi:MAG TPA: ATP-binding protein [bacterium]|jgi:PAS domain S-box-containing protein